MNKKIVYKAEIAFYKEICSVQQEYIIKYIKGEMLEWQYNQFEDRRNCIFKLKNIILYALKCDNYAGVMMNNLSKLLTRDMLESDFNNYISRIKDIKSNNQKNDTIIEYEQEEINASKDVSFDTFKKNCQLIKTIIKIEENYNKKYLAKEILEWQYNGFKDRSKDCTSSIKKLFDTNPDIVQSLEEDKSETSLKIGTTKSINEKQQNKNNNVGNFNPIEYLNNIDDKKFTFTDKIVFLIKFNLAIIFNKKTIQGSIDMQSKNGYSFLVNKSNFLQIKTSSDKIIANLSENNDGAHYFEIKDKMIAIINEINKTEQNIEKISFDEIFEMKTITSKILPNLLSSYLDVLKTNSNITNEDSAYQIISDSLTKIESKVLNINQSIVQDKLTNLSIQQKYINSKF